MKVKDLKETFGEFRTKKRIFTIIDNELYVYNDGDIQTLKKANLNENIKTKVWGLIS